MKQINKEFNNEMGRFEIDFMTFMNKITSEYKKEIPDERNKTVNFKVVIEVYFPIREDIRKCIQS